MDQAHGASAAAGHVPVLLAESASVDLLHKRDQLHRRALRAREDGLMPQPTGEQFQHLRLFAQGVAAPKPASELLQRDVVQFLFLCRCEVAQVGGVLQQLRSLAFSSRTETVKVGG